MTEEQQAEALAAWLAAPAGTPPPDGLDADVVQAVLALRPERAPAMRLGLADVLGSVQAGPLAAPAPVVLLRRWRPVLGAVGALAAAAVALVAVLPRADEAPPALDDATASRARAAQTVSPALEAAPPAVGEPAPVPASPPAPDAAGKPAEARALRGRAEALDLEGRALDGLTGGSGWVGGVLGGAATEGVGAGRGGYGQASTAAASGAATIAASAPAPAPAPPPPPPPPAPKAVAVPAEPTVAQGDALKEAAAVSSATATRTAAAEAKVAPRGPGRVASAAAMDAPAAPAPRKQERPAEDEEAAEVDWQAALAQIRAPQTQGQAVALAVARSAWAAGRRDVAAAAVTRGLSLGSAPGPGYDALVAAQARIARGEAP
ncbi:MAG: hypothetical protein RLZZ383_1110 [Pseudomonadota bacterium]